MGNPLPNVLIGGAICAAIVGYIQTMVFLFILALAMALFHNFASNQLWKKILAILSRRQ